MNNRKYIDRDWPEIVSFYEELSTSERETYQALAELCSAISASHLGKQLYGHTSVFSLCISQTRIPRSPWRPELYQTLTITPVSKTDLLFQRGYWERRVPASVLLPRFNRYLRQLGWNYYPIKAVPTQKAGRPGRILIRRPGPRAHSFS